MLVRAAQEGCRRTAPFLQDADLLLAADCAPFAYAGFHRDFLEGHALIIACPKLDNFQAHQEKLNQNLGALILEKK